MCAFCTSSDTLCFVAITTCAHTAVWWSSSKKLCESDKDLKKKKQKTRFVCPRAQSEIFKLLSRVGIAPQSSELARESVRSKQK